MPFKTLKVLILYLKYFENAGRGKNIEFEPSSSNFFSLRLNISHQKSFMRDATLHTAKYDQNKGIDANKQHKFPIGNFLQAFTSSIAPYERSGQATWRTHQISFHSQRLKDHVTEQENTIISKAYVLSLQNRFQATFLPRIGGSMSRGQLGYIEKNRISR